MTNDDILVFASTHHESLIPADATGGPAGLFCGHGLGHTQKHALLEAIENMKADALKKGVKYLFNLHATFDRLPRYENNHSVDVYADGYKAQGHQ